MGRADDARRGRHSRPPTGPAHGLTSDSRRPAGPASLLSPRGLLPRPGALASACLLALGLLLGGAAPAAAQTVVELVSNIDQDENGSFGFDKDYAQLFSTGGHAQGYKVTRVDLEMQNTAATVPSFSVSIRDSVGDVVVGALTQQGSLPSTFGTVQFTHDGIDLDPSTDYTVVIDVTANQSSDTKARRTDADDEDPNPSAGWTISNVTGHRTWNGLAFNMVDGNSLKITIHGHKKPQIATTTPATLVSNIGQTDGGSASFNNDHRMGFSTGSNTAGYRLSNVVFRMRDTADPTPSFDVTVWESDNSGVLGDQVGTLTQRDDLPSSFGDVQFEAGLLGNIRGLHLKPSSHYQVIIDVTADASGSTLVKRTTSNNENSGAETGFTLFNTRWWRTASSTSWNSESSERPADGRQRRSEDGGAGALQRGGHEQDADADLRRPTRPELGAVAAPVHREGGRRGARDRGRRAGPDDGDAHPGLGGERPPDGQQRARDRHGVLCAERVHAAPEPARRRHAGLHRRGGDEQHDQPGAGLHARRRREWQPDRQPGGSCGQCDGRHPRFFRCSQERVQRPPTATRWTSRGA